MNGLKFIRTRCNISLSELASVLSVSRQQISTWENGVKPISQNRLSQLSKYFGVDEKYFLNISEEDKEYIVSKALYRRQDNEKEVYCFIKQGEMKDDFKYRSFSYPNFEESLDEQMIHAKKKKKETGNMASRTSKYKEVRSKLVELQRQLAKTSDVVMDGRDIGTTVLPDAFVKIYLTASSDARAKRRYDELTAKGEQCDINDIKEDIEKRDYQDMHREISPLKQADDAILLDTSNMNIEQVVAAMRDIIDKAIKNS